MSPPLPSQGNFSETDQGKEPLINRIIPKKINSFTILHTFGDKLFSRAAEDLDLSLKKARSQKDKLILHQKCGRRELNDKGQLRSIPGAKCLPQSSKQLWMLGLLDLF